MRYKSFRYQVELDHPQRIVAKVEHHRGELFPRVGFIVTNMTLPSRSVVRFYNERGTAEQWIKEGKQATHWTRLSCHRFQANEVRSVLYNRNLWRRLVLPPRNHRQRRENGACRTTGSLATSDPAAVRRHWANLPAGRPCDAATWRPNGHTLGGVCGAP